MAGLNSSGCAGKGIPGVRAEETTVGTITSQVSATGKLESAGTTDVVPIAGGTIGELMVSDGDEVEAGEVLAVLQQGSLDTAAEQAYSSYLTTASMGDLMEGMWSNSIMSFESMSVAMQSLTAIQSQADDMVMTFFDITPTLAAFLPPSQQQQVLSWIGEQKSEYLDNVSSRPALQLPSPTSYPSTAAAADAARSALALQNYQLAEAGKSDPRLVAPISGAVVFTPPSGLFPSDLLSGITSSLGGLSSGLAALGGASSLGGDLSGMLSGLFPSDEITTGTKVTAGQAIFQIVDLQNMKVKAQVEESDIPRVKKGQKVKVMLDAYPEEEFYGKVVQVGAKGEGGSSGTTVFPVTIQMDRTEIPLRIGYNAVVDIEVMRSENVIVIQSGALVKSGGEVYVYVVDRGVAVRRDVVVGMESEDLVEIKEGLEEGEQIVVEGANKVKPGSRI